MADQIVLAWTVDVSNSSFGPAEAAAALAAVELYQDDTTDPVLGQHFGLTVSDDTTAPGPTSATRTLTLNMNSNAGPPFAPPPFPCHPNTSTPPVLTYPLQEARTLPGSFFVENGVATVDTTDSQIPSISNGDVIQFLSQQGVFYTVAAPPGSTSITITPAYSGTTANTTAFKEVAAPVDRDRLAIYSSSDFDTNGVATTPAIPAGPGARTVELLYLDSAGAGPFAATAELTGRRPALFTFDNPPGIDVAVIVNLLIDSVGGFSNSVGEITLVELSDALPDLPSDLPVGTGIGAAQGRTFKSMTDEAQLLIERHLAYLPPSYFALAQQGAVSPELEGDFLVTTGATDVFTEEDQTGVLAAGNVIEFALQPGTLYEIASVTAKIVKLTAAFSGIDTNNTGLDNTGTNNNIGTKGNVGKEVIRKATDAMLVSPSPAAPPTNSELAAPLGGFVALEVAAPPPNPPLDPATVPTPTFLSGLFTRTIQLALAGVPITAEPITFRLKGKTMWPLVLLLGIGAGATGTYLLTRKKETPTGEIWGIGLSGVPEGASVDTVGNALMRTLGWSPKDILDGSMDRYAQGTMLTIGFKANVKTPRMPPVGSVFKVGTTDVTVTSVTRAPARVTMGVSEASFP